MSFVFRPLFPFNNLLFSDNVKWRRATKSDFGIPPRNITRRRRRTNPSPPPQSTPSAATVRAPLLRPVFPSRIRSVEAQLLGQLHATFPEYSPNAGAPAPYSFDRSLMLFSPPSVAATTAPLVISAVQFHIFYQTTSPQFFELKTPLSGTRWSTLLPSSDAGALVLYDKNRSLGPVINTCTEVTLFELRCNCMHRHATRASPAATLRGLINLLTAPLTVPGDSTNSGTVVLYRPGRLVASSRSRSAIGYRSARRAICPPVVSLPTSDLADLEPEVLFPALLEGPRAPVLCTAITSRVTSFALSVDLRSILLSTFDEVLDETCDCSLSASPLLLLPPAIDVSSSSDTLKGELECVVPERECAEGKPSLYST